MPPLIKHARHDSDEIDVIHDPSKDGTDPSEPQVEFKAAIVWRNVAIMGYLHLAAAYGLYLCFTSAMIKTSILAYFMYMVGGLGITAGAHRLWSHKTYKAKFPLRMLLMVLNSSAFENDIYEWSRDHRVHHKYSETHADPHNATRGFFFSHVGWLLMKKHPDVRSKGQNIDCSDILADPVVRFQRKFYLPLVAVFCFIVPTLIPYLIFGETLWNSFFVCGILRYVVLLNSTWLVNSAAHMFGNRPYDQTINPSENRFVAYWAIGEGFHNYHHTFPWDYATSEFGIKLNVTTMFIDLMAKIGWAYDRKVVSPEVIRLRKLRTGDGSHDHHHHHHE